jgi:hypothetical protein
MLSHLHLCRQILDKERTQHLLEGLQWNTSLTKVTMICCSFDDATVDVVKAMPHTLCLESSSGYIQRCQFPIHAYSSLCGVVIASARESTPRAHGSAGVHV